MIKVYVVIDGIDLDSENPILKIFFHYEDALAFAEKYFRKNYTSKYFEFKKEEWIKSQKVY